jgi:NAD(P)-dependent dehydrogenase (short-subunit alcohol dehydrogenase family)
MDERTESTHRVALVTAASQGIGAAIARQLAAEGYGVALLARSEKVNDLAAELGGIGLVGSVTDAKALAEFVDRALQRWGRIDALVNNTGHPAKGELLALSDQDWQEGYQLVLESVIRLARQVTPVMRQQQAGAIVNVSSYAALRPELERPVSSVFRAALLAWTRLHAEYCAPFGVRVNSVLPRFVDTYPVEAAVVKSIPLGRPAAVAELARFVSTLLSDNASYLTGQSILLDGGMVKTL